MGQYHDDDNHDNHDNNNDNHDYHDNDDEQLLMVAERMIMITSSICGDDGIKGR